METFTCEKIEKLKYRLSTRSLGGKREVLRSVHTIDDINVMCMSIIRSFSAASPTWTQSQAFNKAVCWPYLHYTQSHNDFIFSTHFTLAPRC